MCSTKYLSAIWRVLLDNSAASLSKRTTILIWGRLPPGNFKTQPYHSYPQHGEEHRKGNIRARHGVTNMKYDQPSFQAVLDADANDLDDIALQISIHIPWQCWILAVVWSYMTLVRSKKKKTQLYLPILQLSLVSAATTCNKKISIDFKSEKRLLTASQGLRSRI